MLTLPARGGKTRELLIGSLSLGDGEPSCYCREIGQNHNGDMATARN